MHERSRREGREGKEAAANALVLRPKFYPNIVTWLMCMPPLTGITVTVIGVHQGMSVANTLAWVVIIAAFIALLALFLFWNRVIINGDYLRILDISDRRQVVPLAQIARITRERRGFASVRDAYGRPLARMRPIYTSHQLTMLADALGVPFEDHLRGRNLDTRK